MVDVVERESMPRYPVRVCGMGRKVIVYSLLAMVISITTIGNAMSKELYVTLHFVIPFSLETYVPVTMNNIESDSHKIWMVKDHGAVSHLLQVLQAVPSSKPINEKAIRFKGDFGSFGGIFYVDRNGIVLRKNDGASFELSETQLLHVERDLQGMVGVVDIKAYDRFRSDK